MVEEKIKLICPDCGKPQINKGSITGWLFSERNCNCLSGQLRITPITKSTAVDISSEDLPVGDLGDNYQFLQLLGKGGMGSVYKIRDLVKDKNFAVKILNSEMANNPDALKRFYKECDALAQLSHPNVVSVYEHGQTSNGFPYLIMDYIDGFSLADVIEETAYLEPGRALGLFIPVAEALAYAHKEGILHRDLKPGNIMLTRSETNETIRLVDFGIAKIMEGNTRMTQDLTETGEVLGTPHYMSPEQCMGFQLDERSDIYSLGCLMCETITGKPPFAGENAIQIVARHLSEPPVEVAEKLANMGTPHGIQGVILACLSKDAKDRYQDCESLLVDLRLIVEGKRPLKSSSNLSNKLRSPNFDLILDILSFSLPVIVYTLIYAIHPSKGIRILGHCNSAALVSFLLFCFYFAKANHLRSSSSFLDKSGNQYSRKLKTLIAILFSSLIFGISQYLLYADYLVKFNASGLERMRYAYPWYFVIFWLILALIPFLVLILHSNKKS